MKTRLVVRDGKVVELKEKDLKPTTNKAFYISKANGLKWGKSKKIKEKRIATDEQGRRRLYVEK
jgi:hypothetical protein